ncbi:MAG TPA: two-component regulator propeller domain-containing protein, partial [Saprospiraceae bacterium]|nr:two-component regulator propeller domain-containing protein [Saprospiraceae bacterium]
MPTWSNHNIFTRWIALLILTGLFFLHQVSFAQNVSDKPAYWNSKRISTEDGLSNRFVNAVLEDNRGFAWIGTNFGLNRYDGYRFDIFTRERDHLQSNTIFQLAQDIHQKIWVVYEQVYNSPINAIDIIDPISFEVTPIEKYIPAMPFTSTDIRKIVQDTGSLIYILTLKNEVYAYDQKGLSHCFSLPADKPFLSGNVVQGRIYVQLDSSRTLDVYDRTGHLTHQFPVPQLPPYFQRISKTWCLGGVLGNGELFFYDSDVNASTRFYVRQTGESLSDPIRIPVDTQLAVRGYDHFTHLLWVSFSTNFYVIDPVTNHVDSVQNKAAPGRTQFSTFRKGLCWINSEDGAWIYTLQPVYFNAYLTNGHPPYSCRSFAEGKDGKIYILTHGGNMIFDPIKKTLEKWPLDNEIVAMTSITDDKGVIWFAGENYYLFKHIPGINGFKKKLIKAVDYFAFWSIIQLRNGKLMLGSTTGVWLKDPSNEDSPVHFSNGTTTLLDKSTVFHMLETDEGVWLSTDNGLFLFDPNTGVTQHIGEKDGLPNQNLLFFCQDTGHINWIASRGGGLIKWNRESNHFQSYTVNEGLSHNVIYAIFPDQHGFLWMPSDKGLMQFEKSTGICRTFLQPDGIPHEEFNRCSYYKHKEGHFYFGGLNGFVVFNPDDFVHLQAQSRPVQLTRFEAINEKTGASKDLSSQVVSGHTLVLSPQVSSFVINYSIPDYDDPKQKRYAYRIDGLNNNWTYLSENFIRINGLKGGDYTLRIKGQNASGMWSEKELVIPITILKPFFARWYAQALILLVLGGLLVVIYRRRNALQRIKLQREMAISQQLRQVDKLKDQFLANTSHELRTPLNGIVGLSESLLGKINTSEEKEDLELIIS